MFILISRALHLVKPTMSNSRSLQIASHTECFGLDIHFHLCEFLCHSPYIWRPSTVPMQIFIDGTDVSDGSNITLFTTPYAVAPSSLYPAALTASSHYIIIPQPHGSPHLPLSHQPPGSPSPIRHWPGRLRRPSLYLVPLTELSPEFCGRPWHYGSCRGIEGRLCRSRNGRKRGGG